MFVGHFCVTSSNEKVTDFLQLVGIFFSQFKVLSFEVLKRSGEVKRFNPVAVISALLVNNLV